MHNAVQMRMRETCRYVAQNGERIAHLDATAPRQSRAQRAAVDIRRNPEESVSDAASDENWHEVRMLNPARVHFDTADWNASTNTGKRYCLYFDIRSVGFGTSRVGMKACSLRHLANYDVLGSKGMIEVLQGCGVRHLRKITRSAKTRP